MQNYPDLDVDFVRNQFSALNGEWAFMENAGGTLTARQVVHRVQDYMSRIHVQPNHLYRPSQEAGQLIEKGHNAISQMIGADQDEVIISPNTTASVFFLANSLRRWFSAGDEIIVTNLDHEANNGVWRKLNEFGLIIKEWHFSIDSGALEIDSLESLLTSKTRMVCFTHCSNITGAINDIPALVSLIHHAGALACVDGVAYAPHRGVDVKSWDVDFYLCSLYKIYGPHLGVLYAKREHLERAANNNHSFLENKLSLKLNPGGPNHELTCGIAGVEDYFLDLYKHHFTSSENTILEKIIDLGGLISKHEEVISKPLVDFLSIKRNVTLFGPSSVDSKVRTPIFSFVVEGRNSAEIVKTLDQEGIGIGSGHFYAPRCLEALGHDSSEGGFIRVSLVHYNSKSDIMRLIATLEKII